MRRFLALLVLLSVIAAACGGSTEGSSDGDTATDAGSSNSETPSEGGTAAASTLEEFFGWGEFDESEWQEQDRQVEEMVAACMAELGWEYIPVDHTTTEYFDPFEDVGEAEWAARYGYGATTFILEDPWLEEEASIPEWTDPNEGYVSSLSDIERDQYFEDLYGAFDEPEIDPDTGEYLEEDFFFDPENGCYNQASAEVYGLGPEVEGSEEDFEAVFGLFEQLEEQIAADPRVIEAEGKWSECMADKGFAYDRPQDAAEHFYMEAERFWRIQEDAWVDPFDGWSEAEIEEWFLNTPPEEQDDFFASFEYGPSFDEQTTAEIEALSKEEIETAVADFECSEEFRELQMEIREEYEGRFIQENLEQLTEIKDAGFF